LVQGGDGDDNLFGDVFGSLAGVGGNDTLYQNAGSGVLEGDGYELLPGARGGNDRLYGTGTLIGDSVVAEGATCGNDLLDALRSTAGSDLRGDVFDAMEGSVGGRDRLNGGAFGDTLLGEATFLLGSSAGGDDRLSGFGGDDAIYGDAFVVSDTSRGGDDVLRGGAGADTMYGDAAALGGSAAGGDDQLYSGGGDDTLWGDGELSDDATGGRDRFHFAGGFGDDTVLDFRRGEDRLVFSGYDPTDLQLALDGGDTLLTTLGDDSVRLVGFTDPLAFGVDVIFA
jgi:serralysin